MENYHDSTATRLCWEIWSQKNNGGQCLMSFFFYLDGTKGYVPHWAPLDYINAEQQGDEQCKNIHLFHKSSEWNTRKCLEMDTYFSSLAPLSTWFWLKKRNIEILDHHVLKWQDAPKYNKQKRIWATCWLWVVGWNVEDDFFLDVRSTVAVPLANTRGSMFPL